MKSTKENIRQFENKHLSIQNNIFGPLLTIFIKISNFQQKSTDTELQKLISENNYAGAITLLLECRSSAKEYNEYLCVQSLNNKLQETLILTEFQLDTVLNEVSKTFTNSL